MPEMAFATGWRSIKKKRYLGLKTPFLRQKGPLFG
jgi:hypothetical protein